jgi:hypothetical protein
MQADVAEGGPSSDFAALFAHLQAAFAFVARAAPFLGGFEAFAEVRDGAA